MTTSLMNAQPAATTEITGAAAQPKESLLATLRPLLLDLAVPLGSYYLLRGVGVGLVSALVASSVLPAARTVAGVLKNRTVNGLAGLIVVVNLVSIAISFWAGDPRLMLAKDSVISSTIAIAILISAFTGRPLMTAGMRPFLVKGDAAKDKAFDRLLAASPRFRRLERMFSVVWGAALLAECVVRLVCVFILPVGTMVWLSTVILLGAIFAAMIVGSFFTVPMENMIKLEAGK
jgi:hypothetical protein